VDGGRDCLEEDLEQPEGWQRDQAEGAVARVEERVAVFPEALESAEGPAEALPRQRLEPVGGLRIGARLHLRRDPVAEPADRPGQVSVLSQGFYGGAARRFNGRPAPGAERAGDDVDAVEQVMREAIEVRAGDVVDSEPA